MALNGTYVPSPAQWVRDNVAEYEATNGAKGGEFDGDRIVVITSVGAKSGDLRKNPVMRIERDGKYLAVGSKGGAPTSPTWCANFLANPEVELQDLTHKGLYRARVLEGEERQDWWEFAVQTWPTYGEYQKKTDRQIPLFLLEIVEEYSA